jgi:hypothetical protein
LAILNQIPKRRIVCNQNVLELSEDKIPPRYCARGIKSENNVQNDPAARADWMAPVRMKITEILIGQRFGSKP